MTTWKKKIFNWGLLQISSHLEVILGYLGFTKFGVLEYSIIDFTKFGVLEFFCNC